MAITIKVAVLGGLVKEVMLEDGSNMDAAFAAAEVDATGKEVKVNGRTPCGNLVDGDIITLAAKVKGGY